MLNFWKKIQEKGLGSPKKKSVSINTLDPRYDGPLKCFDVSVAADAVPLEKSRLSLQIDDIFSNKIAYNYFKYFLETKMISVILDLWNLVIQNSFEEDSNKILKWDKSKDEDRDCGMGDCNQVNKKTVTDTNVLNDFVLKLPEEIRNKIICIIGKSKKIAELELNLLKSTLYKILLENWNEFSSSVWYCRYQIDLLTSMSVTLGDILLHETALSYFTQFLEIEGCQNVVEFWIAATNFQQLVENMVKNNNEDFSQIVNDAISIYEKYLSLLATSPLGFNDDVRCAVEEAICDEIKGPHPDSFELAINTVLAFLRKHYLIPFLSSQHYVHLLSDMIRNCSALIDHSPASSLNEYYTDSKKCFLFEHNPDTIWHRRKQSGLSFGHIDQLGRFQRDIEPDPGRSDGSKISKLMKKLVQRNDTKVEEEMAWQVAEMVVRDITDLTMGNHLENYFAENCIYNKYCK